MGSPCAIIGSGNIGTDLMFKLRARRPGSTRRSWSPSSASTRTADGLARARELGATRRRTTASTGSCEHPGRRRRWSSTRPAPTSTCATRQVLRGGRHPRGRPDPGRRGPKVIAAVNLMEHLDAPELNMVTCGGQATTPMVDAVRRASTPCRTPRWSPPSPRSRPGRARGRTSTSSPRPPRTALRGDRRRRRRQGDHHPQPGRAADPHAQHGLLRPARGHRPRRRHRLGRGDGRGRRRRTSPATGSSTRPLIEEGPFNTPGGVVPHPRPSSCSRSRARATTCRRTPATSTS